MVGPVDTEAGGRGGLSTVAGRKRSADGPMMQAQGKKQRAAWGDTDPADRGGGFGTSASVGCITSNINPPPSIPLAAVSRPGGSRARAQRPALSPPAATAVRISRKTTPGGKSAAAASVDVHESASKSEELWQHLERYCADGHQQAAKPPKLFREGGASTLISNRIPSRENIRCTVNLFGENERCRGTQGQDMPPPENTALQGTTSAPFSIPSNVTSYNSRMNPPASSGVNMLSTMPLISPTQYAVRDPPVHVVLDTCSLLKADSDIMDRIAAHGVVCVPCGVIAELDRWNHVKGRRKNNKYSSNGISGVTARHIRDWITQAVKTHKAARIQRNCEVHDAYDRKVTTADDAILGFAVYLLKEEKLPVTFVTEDKFLQLKAVFELNGNSHTLKELLEQRGW
ncbi:unnamed protein product [Trypanosoma congolense IL3000]|uniref:WGS project CAEQ00000000 data, annotated contig 1662 n=1 Tax=Trypanosoma congolense (strain IL3000) TaxID=1068625 RepID=F9W7W2_TRYCI|nr:unnamed protein product [Trypanosoma congolense IL3000]